VNTIDFSPVAVSFQAVGTLLLSLMLAQIGRIYAWRYARAWALAWFAMFIALLAVRGYVYDPSPLMSISYLIGEWAFLILLYSGCRELASGAPLNMRYVGYSTPLLIATAAVMAHFAPSFNDLFTVQAAIVAAGILASWLILRLTPERRRSTGWRTLRLALVLLALLYALYVPLYFIHTHLREVDFLPYSSLADLLLAVFLGFTMVLTTAEEANRGLTEALSKLEEAQAQLEQKAHTDPLTEALNRHAFYSMQRGDDVVAMDGALSGVVVMIDVDNLKRINDEIGHVAGDAVIRATANAVRTLIRADDLLFRWGGDEFVAIVPNMNLDAVRERLGPLDDGIQARISASGPTMKFHISWGVSEFDPERSLDQAIKIADQEMYATRAASTGESSSRRA
jgi:diguanylate cyclase (GGDEF)-like protein